MYMDDPKIFAKTKQNRKFQFKWLEYSSQKCKLLSKFLKRSLLIIIIKGFRTIVISSRTHGVTVIGVGSLNF